MAFAIGDVVRLNSGGSRMTVKDVHGEFVECVWQSSGELRQEQFASAMLKRVIEPTQPGRKRPYNPLDSI